MKRNLKKKNANRRLRYVNWRKSKVFPISQCVFLFCFLARLRAQHFLHGSRCAVATLGVFECAYLCALRCETADNPPRSMLRTADVELPRARASRFLFSSLASRGCRSTLFARARARARMRGECASHLDDRRRCRSTRFMRVRAFASTADSGGGGSGGGERSRVYSVFILSSIFVKGNIKVLCDLPMSRAQGFFANRRLASKPPPA